MANDWYPEGGFYETRAKQGESEWEDAAQFDVGAIAMSEDMRGDDENRAGGVLSISDLTKPASDDFQAGKVYGS